MVQAQAGRQAGRRYRTVLLGADRGWVCSSNLGSSFLGKPDKEVVDFLKIRVRHDGSRGEGTPLCGRVDQSPEQPVLMDLELEIQISYR